MFLHLPHIHSGGLREPAEQGGGEREVNVIWQKEILALIISLALHHTEFRPMTLICSTSISHNRFHFEEVLHSHILLYIEYYPMHKDMHFHYFNGDKNQDPFYLLNLSL